MKPRFRAPIFLHAVCLLLAGCSTNPSLTPQEAYVAHVVNANDNRPVTMREGFEFTGELDYIPGERIGETIERAGGFSGVIFRTDVVRIVPEREDPVGGHCLADQETTRTSDILIAVRKGAISRSFSCSLPAGPDTISFGRGFVFSGVYEFEEGLTLSETIIRAGGLYVDGYLQEAVWGRRMGGKLRSYYA